MLSIAPIAGGGAGYYTAQDNYYFLGSAESRWLGEGAKELGLEGAVDARQLDELIAGRLPDGTSLERMSGGVNTHRSGYDLTFSAPKSVSVLITLYGESRLLDAHNNAVEAVSREIESLVSTRVMADGIRQQVSTGSMVAATFNHDTSRELDPQVHTHFLLLNMTEKDGQWYTLSSDTRGRSGTIDALYDNKIALGQIYRSELRRQVEAMGLETISAGKHDLWEIKGVPTEPFSTRSQQIREVAGEDASAKSRDVAALDTRQTKQKEPDRDELLTQWHERMDKTGFSYRELRDEAAARVLDQAKHPQASGTAKAQTVAADMQQAVSQAISLLSDRKTQFSYSEVLSRTLAQVNAQPGSIALARGGIEVAIGRGELVPLDKEKGLFTSSIHLLDELSVQHLARQMARDNRVMVIARLEVALSGAIAVLADTLPAVAIVATGRGAAALREGIQAMVALAEGQGRKVQVMATDKRSAAFLSEQSGLAGRVTDKSLLTVDSLVPDSTLVVSGAEKLSVKEALTLLDQASRRNVQVLLADSGGRQGTGSALATLQEAGVVRLQTDRHSGVSVEVVSSGDRRQRYAQLASDYAALGASGEAVVAQAPGREQPALVEAIRHRLREESVLATKEHMVKTLTPVFLDSKTRNQSDSYREGQVLERFNPETRCTERHIIDRVTARSRTLTLKDDTGKSQMMKLSDIDSSWRLYQPGTLAVAEGEKLVLTGRQGKLSSGDAVTVGSVTEHLLTVRHGGQVHRLQVRDGLRVAQGYVTSPGKDVREQGTVLAAVSARDTQAQMLNTLAVSGDKVRLYTSLAEDEAHSRLSRSPLYRQAREQVSPDGRPLDTAMRQARDSLMPVPEKAVRQAIAVVQGSEVVFSRLDVAQEALKMHPEMNLQKVNATFRALVSSGEMLAVPGDKSGTRFVPAESYLQEKAIIRTLAEGKATQSALMPGADRALFQGLTPGQQSGSRLILESTDRFIAIQGYAGVGKTTQFRTVLTALDTLPAESKPDILGLAPTHRAVSEMQGVGVKAQTIASFLMDTERRLRSGEKLSFGNTLFLVDESSMVGNRDMADTLTRIAALGGRAVLSGDSLQLQAVASGAPFTLMQQRSAIDVAVMKDIVRQTPELRPAVYALLEGRAPEALETIRCVTPAQIPRESGGYVPVSSVTEIRQTKEQKEQDGDRVIAAIVDDYTGRTTDARRQTLIVTQTNADSAAINAGIHERLHEQGKLGTREVDTEILVREKTQTESLKSVAGLARYNGNIALINQQYYTLHSPDGKNGVVMLQDQEGKDHLLSAFESSLRDIAVFSRQSIRLSEGDLVRFTRNDREQGRDTQTLWTVGQANADGSLTLQHGSETRLIQPGKDLQDSHLDYAYAGTAHRAQGASESFVIALAGATGSRKMLAGLSDAYVALSRMKEHVQVYTDNLSDWMSAVADSTARLTAHDVLGKEQDRRAATGQTLWESAGQLNTTAIGRALLRETGLPAEGEARFIGGSRKYPSPHVAWPAYDRSGNQQGVWLSEIRRDEEGRLQGIGESGRLLGAESAVLIVVQQSRSGVTLQATDQQEALKLAASHPESGVVLTSEKAALPDWLLQKLTQGQRPENIAPLASAQTQDSTVVILQTPEEKAQQAAEQAVREALRQEKDRNITLPEPDGRPHPDTLIQQGVEQELRRTDREPRLEERETERLAARELQTAKAITAQEHLRELEKEIVLTREKTL